MKKKHNNRKDEILVFPSAGFLIYMNLIADVELRRAVFVCQMLWDFLCSPLTSYRCSKILAIANNNQQEALKLIENLPDRHLPHHYAECGNLFIHSKCDEVIIAFLQKYLPNDHRPWPAHVALCDFYLRIGKTHQAFELISDLKHKVGERKHWQIEYQLGRTYNRLHDHEAALESYNQALKCKHKKRVKRIIMYAITYTYCQMGKFQEALALNAEIMRQFPRAKGPRITRSAILKHIDKDLLKSEHSQ